MRQLHRDAGERRPDRDRAIGVMTQRGKGPLFRLALLAGALLLAAISLAACFRLLPTPATAPTAPPIAKLEPTVALQPASGYAGIYVRVNGQGWPANTLVILVLADAQGRSGILAASSAEPNGQLNTGFLYPISDRWLRAGPVSLLAYTADGNVQATAQFQVTPPGIEATPLPSPTPTVTVTPGSATAIATATSPLPSPTPTVPPTATPLLIRDWRGDYWANPNLAGEPVLTRNDPAIAFDWGPGSPDPALPHDGFSARWTRSLEFDAGLYRFMVQVDDGVRLFIDGRLVLDDWNIGSMRTLVAAEALTAGRHELRLEYFEGSGQAAIRFAWERQESFSGWRGEYFANPTLSGAPLLVRDDAAIDFRWGEGAPAPGLPVDGFSVRWTREVPFVAGTYRFVARADDGVRFWIDDVLVIDEWHESASNSYSIDIALSARVHFLRVEYYEGSLGAGMELWWERLPEPTPTYTPSWTPSPTDTPVPQATGTATPTPLPSATATETATPTATESPQVTAAAPASATPTLTATPRSPNWQPLPLLLLTQDLSLRAPQPIYRIFSDERVWRRFLIRSLAQGTPAPLAQRRSTPTASAEPPVPTDLSAYAIDFERQVLVLVHPGDNTEGSTLAITGLYWHAAQRQLIVQVVERTAAGTEDDRRQAVQPDENRADDRSRGRDERAPDENRRNDDDDDDDDGDDDADADDREENGRGRSGSDDRSENGRARGSTKADVGADSARLHGVERGAAALALRADLPRGNVELLFVDETGALLSRSVFRR